MTSTQKLLGLGVLTLTVSFLSAWAVPDFQREPTNLREIWFASLSFAAFVIGAVLLVASIERAVSRR